MRAGEYAVPPGTSPRTLLQMFVSGAVVQHSVTVVEGWSFRDLRRAMAREPTLEHTTRGRRDAEVMTLLGEPGRHPEGLFFPDTYLYGKGTRDIEILRTGPRTHAQGTRRQRGRPRQTDLPLQDAYEALILASIVERETGLADGAAAHRRRVRRAPASRHAPADRPDRDLWTR